MFGDPKHELRKCKSTAERFRVRFPKTVKRGYPTYTSLGWSGRETKQSGLAILRPSPCSTPAVENNLRWRHSRTKLFGGEVREEVAYSGHDLWQSAFQSLNWLPIARVNRQKVYEGRAVEQVSKNLRGNQSSTRIEKTKSAGWCFVFCPSFDGYTPTINGGLSRGGAPATVKVG